MDGPEHWNFGSAQQIDFVKVDGPENMAVQFSIEVNDHIGLYHFIKKNVHFELSTFGDRPLLVY